MTASRYHPARAGAISRPVAKGTKKIDELAALLEKTGGDAQRLEVVRRAQKFKRSWIELAEALTKVRATKGYARWGFEDFYDYCARELTLKRATVDKLTLSYTRSRPTPPRSSSGTASPRRSPATTPSTTSRAPSARPPTSSRLDERRAVRASPASRARPRDPELVREMKAAVFDEGQPVAELRKRFDPSSTRGPRAPTASSCSPRPPPAPASSPSCSPTSRASRRSASASSRRSSAPCARTSSSLAEPLREQVARAQKRLQKPPKRAGRPGV
jgi:hypothetical protein